MPGDTWTRCLRRRRLSPSALTRSPRLSGTGSNAAFGMGATQLHGPVRGLPGAGRVGSPGQALQHLARPRRRLGPLAGFGVLTSFLTRGEECPSRRGLRVGRLGRAPPPAAARRPCARPVRRRGRGRIHRLPRGTLPGNSHALGRGLSLIGLTLTGVGGALGGHLAHRQASGAHHAGYVAHVVTPGRHALGEVSDFPPRAGRPLQPHGGPAVRAPPPRSAPATVRWSRALGLPDLLKA